MSSTALSIFNDYAEVLSNINACREFFSWTASGIKTAMRYRLNEDNAAAQCKIQEDSKQLETKLEQLKDDLWKLKTTMPKMFELIDRVEFQSHKNLAADLLPEIKDVVYDAEDLLDEFDYYALKLKVECSKNLGRDQLHHAFLEFLDRVGSNDYIREVNKIQEKLDYVHRESMDRGLLQAPLKFDKSVRPETSSYSKEPKIFGREKELKDLVKALGVPERKRGRPGKMTELPVLSIVGMGGIGKSTMAQQICQDTNVKKHFDRIIWTCVSDDFDIKRLTKEIIEAFEKDTSSNNLDVLMRKLENHLKSKRFLLVLDDMWDDILKDHGEQWKSFLAPLKIGAAGSRILVTTRSPEVANLVGPTNQYELKGLQDEVFRNFFKLCAFGPKSSCNNRLQLEEIGEKIVPKLKGSPLAAKTIGRLLGTNLSTAHWEYILNNELWELKHTETDILPALRLSYIYLPQTLKRCFSICAMYPKDHKFYKGFLADIWIAQGYVVEPKEALECFKGLTRRSFFQKASPYSEYYVIHDLMHDTAQLVSKDECFILKHASDLNKVPQNVRHLSISANGDVKCSELKRICDKKKLRSLVCDESYMQAKGFEAVIDRWFSELLKIRVLIFKPSKVEQLPESMGNSKHLRYLGLQKKSAFRTFPSSVCRLHRLSIIDSGSCFIERFPLHFSDAISLQRIKSKCFTYIKDQSDKLSLEFNSKSVEIMENQIEVVPHWNIQHLQVNNYGGKSCPSWLRPNLLPRLRSLEFHKCTKMKGIQFFVPLEESHDNTAGSANLCLLEELVMKDCDEISWQGSVSLPTSLKKIELEKSGYHIDHLVRCFRDLTSLTHLEIKSCDSLTSIPLDVWMSNLPSLKNLHISGCNYLTSISVAGASSGSSSRVGFPVLTEIHIEKCNKLLSLDDFLTPDHLPAVKKISVIDCNYLTSISVGGASSGGSSRVGFPVLTEIHIEKCNKLLSLDDFLMPDYLPAVKKISVRRCEELTSLSVGKLDGLQWLDIAYSSKLNMQNVRPLPRSVRKITTSRDQDTESSNDFRNSQLGSRSSAGGSSDKAGTSAD